MEEKKCTCSADCTCGCQEGKECTCIDEECKCGENCECEDCSCKDDEE